MFSTLNNFQYFWDRIKDCFWEELQVWGDFQMKYKAETFPIEKDDYFSNLKKQPTQVVTKEDPQEEAKQ